MASVNVENIDELVQLFEQKMGFPADSAGLEMTEEQLVNFMLLCHKAEYNYDDEEEEYEEEMPMEEEVAMEVEEEITMEVEEAAEYQGKKVTLNKPFYTPDGPKKSAVYVNGPKDKVVIVRFGDPNMEIKKDDPERRKSFRARHNCDNPGPKWKARYWSCKAW